MGSHRADHRAPQPSSASGYVGKRVAQRAVSEAPSTYVGKRVARPVDTPAPVAPVEAAAPVVPAEPVLIRGLERTPTVELPALRDIPLLDPLTDSSTQLRAVGSVGKRRATRHSGPRGPLFKGLPTLPVAVGVATLAVAVGGAVVSADPQLASGGDRVAAANAMTGSFGNGSVTERVDTVSRDSDRDALSQANPGDLEETVELSVKQRDTALDDLAKAAEKEAAEIALNKWGLPLKSYRLTATFGEYGLWSSYHTGLDFAAPSGTPIYAVTNGTVTSASFDGAYGNKTVLTLEDGTELWFCHQTAFNVSVGDTVRTGQLIGYVGSTGHVTGPHLHLEVRPGGGDPVDPDAALRQHGVTP
ncbi:murein DD-endopeptidase MepM/ murein hydrolase activator NlpD [Nocardioides aromaticivorans]|uniref:Murein DD-endopeptidase MepM/ murein hydrolase activator NlpD n=2 Tax=Nocardioides aromaticivorans TaxID=200618 RepID=A0A7Y9ZF55_9ACTN|nr:M23 family metallopeptidase [Nocardioides aromaticivorans]NYI43760.1 murein DD-endopeptidase MepM/ murein hydrolase activator NlpD [Nocardioides aromaticivorans]